MDIKVKIIGGEVSFEKIENQVNEFLEKEVSELIDIKASESATNDEWNTTILIMYVPKL